MTEAYKPRETDEERRRREDKENSEERGSHHERSERHNQDREASKHCDHRCANCPVAKGCTQ